jgi:hypothetical protein
MAFQANIREKPHSLACGYIRIDSSFHPAIEEQDIIGEHMSDRWLAIPMRRSRIVGFLFFLAGCLFILNGVVLFFVHGLGHNNVLGFVPLFHMDFEGNVPTYFSSILLLLSANLFYWLSRLEQDRGEIHPKHWFGLSLIFIFLSLDEVSKIHEQTIEPLRNYFELTGPLFFSWVIIGMAGVALLGLIYIRMVLSLPSQFRNALLLSGLVYLGGVLGFELIGGNYASLYGIQTLPYHLLTTCEETLEMTGLILLINALLKHLQSNQTHIGYQFEG